MPNPVDNNKKQISQLLDPSFMRRLDGLDVLSRKILQGKLHGERRSKRRGQSVEFEDHRPYVPGDDIRFIDWNIYARLEQIFLKLFLEEQDLTVNIAVDVSGSMQWGTPDKSHFARQLAAALGYISLVNNNRLTLSCYSHKIIRQSRNMRGRIKVAEMADNLLSTENNGHTDFDHVCKLLSETRSGKGIMILISDFLYKEGYQSGLRRLIGRNYDLYIIQTLSPQELSPSITGDLKLVDIEDDDTAEITVSRALIEYYKKNVRAYCAELNDFCSARGARYMLINTESSIEKVVLNYLRKNRLLK